MWATACPQVDHTHDGRPRPSPPRAFMRSFCLDPGPYGCTKGYRRNNTVLAIVHTQHTQNARACEMCRRGGIAPRTDTPPEADRPARPGRRPRPGGASRKAGTGLVKPCGMRRGLEPTTRIESNAVIPTSARRRETAVRSPAGDGRGAPLRAHPHEHARPHEETRPFETGARDAASDAKQSAITYCRRRATCHTPTSEIDDVRARADS